MERTTFAAACRRAAPLAFALVLHGCAVVTAPGFDYVDPGKRTSITLGQYVSSDPDNPPQGVITPITPALIRAQAELRVAQTGVPAEVRQLFGTTKPYTIGPSDIIRIEVYGQPDLQSPGTTIIGSTGDPTAVTGAPGFIVSYEGLVVFPLIGRVPVGGLTEIEAAELVRDRLSRFIRNPQVTVRISAFRSRRVYVEGEVRVPGSQVITDVPMTLAEAVNRAGGITSLGDRSHLTLTRGRETVVIDLLQLQEAGANPAQIMLEGGDYLTVRNREENRIFVMGEVARPAALAMRNGRMTLNDALGEAGGPNLSTANTGQVYVIRSSPEGSPSVFHLNASSPVALALANTFRLRPRDVVYIDPVPLVNWNRVISLVLPSAQAISTSRDALLFR